MLGAYRKNFVVVFIFFVVLTIIFRVQYEMDHFSGFLDIQYRDLSLMSFMVTLFFSFVIALDFIFFRFNFLNVNAARLFSVIFSKKHQEDMLLVKKLKDEGIITQEEYEKKISQLKEKSGF